jgi:glyoxylase-like metal-dependent hydrolase (beta-lactamase superfamily II)
MKLTDNLYFYPEKGMLDCNTYVIKDDVNVIIDPGSAQYLPQRVAELFKDGIDPKDINIITNTHLHPDHCWANEAFKNISGAKIVIHPLHKQFYDMTVTEASRLLGFEGMEFKADSYFENDTLNTGHMEFEFIRSPGHSPESICFYCRQEKILIPGDVIFAQNTGRVDLPGGNGEELKQSIEALSKLEIEYLLPGHMDIVAGAQQVKRNFEFVKKYVFPWL